MTNNFSVNIFWQIALKLIVARSIYRHRNPLNIKYHDNRRFRYSDSFRYWIDNIKVSKLNMAKDDNSNI